MLPTSCRIWLAPLLALLLGGALAVPAGAVTGPTTPGTWRYLNAPTYERQQAMAISDDRKIAAYRMGDSIYVRNFANPRPRRIGATAQDWVAMSGDGRYVFYSNANGRVVRWNRGTGASTTLRNDTYDSYGAGTPAISRDGRFLFNRGSRLDLATGHRTTIVPVADTQTDTGYGLSGDLTPDARAAAYFAVDRSATEGKCVLRIWTQTGGSVDTAVKPWCQSAGQVWIRAAGSVVFFAISSTDGSDVTSYRRLDVATTTVKTIVPPRSNRYRGGEDPVQYVHLSADGKSMVYGLENYWSCEPISCTEVRRWNMSTGSQTIVYRDWRNNAGSVIVGYPVAITANAAYVGVDMSGWDRTPGGEKGRLGIWHQ